MGNDVERGEDDAVGSGGGVGRGCAVGGHGGWRRDEKTGPERPQTLGAARWGME